MSGERESGNRSRNVGSVRDQLHEMGYFGGPLGRFISHDLSPRESVFRISLKVGLRVGVVFGALCSALMTGLVFLHHQLSALDAAKLAADFFLVYGVAAGAIAAATGLIVGFVGYVRQSGFSMARHTAIVIGVLAAILIFGYFGLWWWCMVLRAQPADFWQWWIVGPVAGMAVISVVVGLLVYSVAMTFAQKAEALERHARHPKLLAAFFLFLVLAGAAGVVIWRRPFASHEAAPSAWEQGRIATTPGRKVVWIAVDGMDYDTVRALIADGETPRLERLMESRRPARVLSGGVTSPPALWTTVATGVSPKAHGITGFEVRAVRGLEKHIAVKRGPSGVVGWFWIAFPFFRLTDEIPLSGLMRTRKTVWEIASEAGLGVGAVNWWATWPADHVRGFVASDRLFPAIMGRRGETNLTSGLVYPPKALAEIRQLADFVNTPESDMLGLRLTGAERDWWRRSVRMDRFQVDVFDHFYRKYRPDFAALYLQGADVFFSHLTSKLGETASLPALEQRVNLMRRYGRFLDQLVGRVLNRVGNDAVVFWISMPGYRRVANLKGALGARCVEGRLPPMVSVYDIAPTTLAVLGLPTAKDMPGVVLSCLSPDLKKRKPQKVSSFGAHVPVVVSTEDETDSLARSYLRSLGYIR